MPRNLILITERIEVIRAAWKEIAPQESFAGMSLEQFETASEAPLRLRRDIQLQERQLEGLKADRALSDTAAARLLELVVSSVKGTPSFGSDSPLYRAMGYVRRSERKTGLTRKAVVMRHLEADDSGEGGLPAVNVA